MPIRKKRMEKILDEMDPQKQYSHRAMLKLVQMTTGFRRNICREYIEDMKRIGLLKRGQDARFLVKSQENV